MHKRNGSKETMQAGKCDARLDAGALRLSDIKAAYAKEIACLKTEIAVLKDRLTIREQPDDQNRDSNIGDMGCGLHRIPEFGQGIV